MIQNIKLKDKYLILNRQRVLLFNQINILKGSNQKKRNKKLLKKK